jgi:hypothetical protein
LWDKCRGPDSKKSVPRNVFISFYRDQVAAALLFNQSDTAKQGLKVPVFFGAHMPGVALVVILVPPGYVVIRYRVVVRPRGSARIRHGRLD